MFGRAEATNRGHRPRYHRHPDDLRAVLAATEVTDMTTIYIARHGETVWHAENRYAGVSDIPLTGHGLEQAQALAAWAGNASLDAVYSSPLIRATTTASPAAQAANVQLLIDARLVEIDWGEGRGPDARRDGCRIPRGLRSLPVQPRIVALARR